MAVRENEIRVEYLGYSAEKAIHIKYVLSGVLAGVGGVIMALTVGHVDPDSMVYWTVSGDFVFITILAGTGNVGATFIGALVYELLRTYAFEFAPEIWQLILGGALLLIIMFLPDGLWSLRSEWRSRRALAAARSGKTEKGEAAMTRVLEVRDLQKSFGGVVAAHNINVTVDTGETIGIIGANGAGKTTFVNMVTGYLPPSGGTIEFLGGNVVGMHPREVTRLGLCRSFQVPQVFLSDSVFDNMIMAYGIAERTGLGLFTPIHTDERAARVDAQLKRYQIEDYRDAAASACLRVYGNCWISPWRRSET